MPETYGENLYQIWLELNDTIKDLDRETAERLLNDYAPERLLFRMEEAASSQLDERERRWKW